ncbi:hypothetical protein JW935_03195 [candidate division KSB1 bacterium]|nr:hypothetical protein [candidate division KSB1 bacterium]
MKKTAFLVFGIVMTLNTVLSAQITYSGLKGLLHIYDADTIHPGLLYFNLVYSGFTKKNQDGTNLIEDNSVNVALTFGLSHSFEFFGHFVPYQDDQIAYWGPFGDSRAGLKFHIPTKKGSTSHFGLVAYANFPTGYRHNLMFEPFTTDKKGWLLAFVGTFDFKDRSNTLPIKLSINMGYRDHDWNDRYFTDRKDQIVGGFGFKFPIRSSILFSELSGEIFLNNLEYIQFGQNLLRYTQGIRFLGPGNIIFDIAADVELGGYRPKEIEKTNPFLKDYADWKIYIGMSYSLKVFEYLSQEERLEKKQSRKETQKLDEIKNKRENVIKELEDLRQKLEKEKQPEPE